MTSHRRDPYLWLHLAGLATVPLWLDVCLAGLAVGEPIVPPWLEITTLTLVSVLPIVWLQLQRPFYIFSVPGLALRPDRLSVERRRLLTIQRNWWSRGLVVLTAIALWFMLYRLYQMAPMAIDLPWLSDKSRATGWAICAGGFGLANLFALVPATVVPLLLISPRQLEHTTPFKVTKVLTNFLVVGVRLGRILPDASAASETFISESIGPTQPAVGEQPDQTPAASPGTDKVIVEKQSIAPESAEVTIPHSADSSPVIQSKSLSAPEGSDEAQSAVVEEPEVNLGGDSDEHVADATEIDKDDPSVSTPSMAPPSDLLTAWPVAPFAEDKVSGGESQTAIKEFGSHMINHRSAISAADVSITAEPPHRLIPEDSDSTTAIVPPPERHQALQQKMDGTSTTHSDASEPGDDAVEASKVVTPAADNGGVSELRPGLHSVPTSLDPS
ncbi:low-complexity tail membrane protein [Leptolyngbya iicbica]|uniref:Low-complexity tail membrane protein n=2 Tax=Cyanophyceae TaxID=3028117 RepID=A0A4Q7EGG0_9CYAN|nr:low-complexity tail membrane protein [Leptolyngbya sp. LK]RZM82425.1 low-complexity tail membrane protein [Leptolyngbya sp. LK]